MDELLTRLEGFQRYNAWLIEHAQSLDELERIRVCLFGRKGIYTLLLREIWQ